MYVLNMTKKGAPLEWIKNVAMDCDSEDCLDWPFSKDVNGYGVIFISGKRSGAHRVVCEMKHGSPPSEVHQAAHRCGMGHFGCVNPSHVSWKTRSENEQDKADHGTKANGSRNGASKLSDNEVKKIRQFYGSKSRLDLSRMFGVSEWTIGQIQKGHSWKHVK